MAIRRTWEIAQWIDGWEKTERVSGYPNNSPLPHHHHHHIVPHLVESWDPTCSFHSYSLPQSLFFTIFGDDSICWERRGNGRGKSDGAISLYSRNPTLDLPSIQSTTIDSDYRLFLRAEWRELDSRSLSIGMIEWLAFKERSRKSCV